MPVGRLREQQLPQRSGEREWRCTRWEPSLVQLLDQEDQSAVMAQRLLS